MDIIVITPDLASTLEIETICYFHIEERNQQVILGIQYALIYAKILCTNFQNEYKLKKSYFSPHSLKETFETFTKTPILYYQHFGSGQHKINSSVPQRALLCCCVVSPE